MIVCVGWKDLNYIYIFMYIYILFIFIRYFFLYLFFIFHYSPWDWISLVNSNGSYQRKINGHLFLLLFLFLFLKRIWNFFKGQRRIFFLFSSDGIKLQFFSTVQETESPVKYKNAFQGKIKFLHKLLKCQICQIEDRYNARFALGLTEEFFPITYLLIASIVSMFLVFFKPSAKSTFPVIFH